MIKKDTKLKEILKLGNVCNQCGHCCSYGSGSLDGDDIEKISAYLKVSKEKLKKDYLEEIEKFNTKRIRPKLLRKKGMPFGKCIFLKEKKCEINPVKPLECKVGNCSEKGKELMIWFALNYYVNEKDPESIRQFEIFLKDNQTIEGGNLKDFIKDKKQLKKILSFEKLR